MKNLLIAAVVLAIVIQFGKVQRDDATGDTRVFEPGLHFKFPFIDSV